MGELPDRRAPLSSPALRSSMTKEKHNFIAEYEALCRKYQMRITTSTDAPYTEGKPRVLDYTKEPKRTFDHSMEWTMTHLKATAD